MTSSVPFLPQYTWRKLGYLAYTDSLSYRRILEQNPQWKVTELPPIGAQLHFSPTSSTPGGLTQGSFLFTSPGKLPGDIYPFDSEQEYLESLNRYTLQGVVDRETLNGVTADSPTAITGTQAG